MKISARVSNVESVDVDVDGEFGGEGEPAQNVTCAARVVAHATEGEIASA